MEVRARVFVVGCPRSGTTLLQSFLAAHPQIISFPESHFFVESIPSHPLLWRLGFASPRGRRRMRAFLAEAGAGKGGIPRTAFLLRQYAASFVEALDSMTVARNGEAWVEKTPDHLRCVGMIKKHVPRARFLHVVRHGEDVVASLYDVGRRFPQQWSHEMAIDRCIARWNEAMRRTRRYRGRPHHRVIGFTDLVQQPARVLEDVCSFLGLPYDPAMIEGRREAARGLVLEREGWKRGALEDLRSERKFDHLFDAATKEYIRRRLDGGGVPDVAWATP
jgi:hypothetical protein